MLNKTLLFSSIVLVGLIGPTKPAQSSAMDVKCADIGIPKIGDICHMTTPISYRRKGSDGRSNYKQMFERFNENWTITGWEFKQSSSFGSTSGPHVSAVSSSGSASMTTDLIEKNKSLSEVKANLESNIATCPTDALCSKSKKSLEAINSKMHENSNVIKSTMNKGNNEALTITGSASVSCTLGICSGGASKQGTLYIFQRYLGDPSSQANETESVVQEGRETLALLNNYDPQSNPVLSEPEKESESSVAPKNPSIPNDAMDTNKVSKKVIRKCKKGKKFYKKNKSMCKQALQASR